MAGVSLISNSFFSIIIIIIITNGFDQDFVRVVAHFRPVKKNPAKNKLNTRWEFKKEFLKLNN